MEEFYTDYFKSVLKSEMSAAEVFDLTARELIKATSVGLVTIARFIELDQSFQRVYSSLPEDCPVSGRKPANRTWWSDVVIKNKDILSLMRL